MVCVDQVDGLMIERRTAGVEGGAAQVSLFLAVVVNGSGGWSIEIASWGVGFLLGEERAYLEGVSWLDPMTVMDAKGGFGSEKMLLTLYLPGGDGRQKKSISEIS